MNPETTSDANLLHLSDLHFGTEADASLWHGQLSDDLRKEMGCDHLDGIIISGDIANFAVKAEYDAAKIFIEKVCRDFDVPADSLVIVPGNHDLN